VCGTGCSSAVAFGDVVLEASGFCGLSGFLKMSLEVPRPNFIALSLVSGPMYGLVTYGLVTYGLVTYGLVTYGLVTYGLVTYGLVTYGLGLEGAGLGLDGCSNSRPDN